MQVFVQTTVLRRYIFLYGFGSWFLGVPSHWNLKSDVWLFRQNNIDTENLHKQRDASKAFCVKETWASESKQS